MQPNFFLRALKASALMLFGLWCFSVEVAAQSGPPPVATPPAQPIQVTPTPSGPPPVATPPAQPIAVTRTPSGPPPASGPRVNLFYDKKGSMESVPLLEVTANCYKVYIGGYPMWFPRSAFDSLYKLTGRPTDLYTEGLDYNFRREEPCAAAPASIPPFANVPGAPTPTGPPTVNIYYGKTENMNSSLRESQLDEVTAGCYKVIISGNEFWFPKAALGLRSEFPGSPVALDYNARISTSGPPPVPPPVVCVDPTPSGPPPVATPPAQPIAVTRTPSGPPPVASGPTVKIYYGKTLKMLATAPLVEVTAVCYQINYGGRPLWFPKSALGYRSDFPGNPVALDYNARRNTPCGG